VDTLQLLHEYDMPTPLTFKEEGGVSLSPDGTKFIAVSFCGYFGSMVCRATIP
jgi:hypothetical protein